MIITCFVCLVCLPSHLAKISELTLVKSILEWDVLESRIYLTVEGGITFTSYFLQSLQVICNMDAK